MQHPRKRTRFEFCDRHAPWFAGDPIARKIESMVEGGPGGWAPGCAGGRCRLWPGLDRFEPSVCDSEMRLDWTEQPAPEFPNVEPKPVGTFVRNVHPCGHSDEEGVVIQADEWPERTGGTLTVATGIGGTTYGPAHNWRPMSRRPAWLVRAIDDGNARAIGLLEAVEAIHARELEAVA